MQRLGLILLFVGGCGVSNEEHEALQARLRATEAALSAAEQKLAAMEAEQQVKTAAGLEIELPKAASGDRVTSSVVVQLSLDEVRINGQVVAPEKVADIFEASLAKGDPDELRLMISSDENVSFEQVVRIMDEAKRAGIDHIAFAQPVEPEPLPSPR